MRVAHHNESEVLTFNALLTLLGRRSRQSIYDLMRRESVPADELMGRRMETGVLAVLAQLRARRNWHRISREWIYGDPPATELGELEWAYFEERGVARVPGLAQRV